MAELQEYFLKFHKIIKLSDIDENATLREKRDIVINKLRDRLKQIFEEKWEFAPSFTHFNQGSYAMGTGIEPFKKGDYDIDVGLEFHIDKEDYPDPVKVKQWVFDALNRHTNRVECRKPCVTVFYQSNDEPIYHVDLAIYAKSSEEDVLYLARGKLNSSSEERVWETSEPKKLMELIKDKFSEADDRKQFRRVIRYLKRWKDMQFSSSGNAAPIGIGITVAAYYWFNVGKYQDPFTGKVTYNDFLALKSFVDRLISKFSYVYNEEELALRLQVELPVLPKKDLFEKMTNKHMSDFKEKLELLQGTLEEVGQEADPHEACKKLRRKFGDDFPVPDKKKTASKSVAPAIISSSSSA
jgi:hypothetical protein